MLNTIKFTAVYSATGNVTLSKSVIRTLNYIKSAGRNLMSVEDVTFVLNNNLSADEQVTEKRVASEMKRFAVECSKGMQYNAMAAQLVSIDGFFYQY